MYKSIQVGALFLVVKIIKGNKQGVDTQKYIKRFDGANFWSWTDEQRDVENGLYTSENKTRIKSNLDIMVTCDWLDCLQ